MKDELKHRVRYKVLEKMNGTKHIPDWYVSILADHISKELGVERTEDVLNLVKNTVSFHFSNNKRFKRE